MDSGSSQKRTTRVTIFNQPYTLVVAGEERDVQQLAETVDGLMREIASRSGNLDSSGVAVLTCLHLADRLRALERDLADLRRRVDSKSRDFNLLLDRAINP